jgi:hypothetical protein
MQTEQQAQRSFSRNAPVAQAAMTVMLLAMAVFSSWMAVISSHSSELTCDGELRCVHVERYPFGLTRQTALPPITVAVKAWDGGGRTTAIKLVLHHADETSSEYQGVGTNGNRVEAVAKAINAFLKNPSAEQVFPLREASVAFAMFAALMAFCSLVLLPYFFTKVDITMTANNIEFVVGRWPARRSRFSCPWPAFQGFCVMTRTVGPQELHTIGAKVDRNALPVQGDTIDLGIAFGSKIAAEQRVEQLQTWVTEFLQRGQRGPSSYGS